MNLSYPCKLKHTQQQKMEKTKSLKGKNESSMFFILMEPII